MTTLAYFALYLSIVTGIGQETLFDHIHGAMMIRRLRALGLPVKENA